MKTVYLDTETTGLDADDEIVEIAIVDDNENVLVNTLVRPVNRPEWPDAENIHGISPKDVRNAPTQTQISDDIRDAVRDRRVVIYNAKYDSQYLPELESAAEISCCMEQFTEFKVAQVRSALLRFAPVRSASLRFAYLRFTPVRSVYPRFAPVRSALERSALVSLTP